MSDTNSNPGQRLSGVDRISRAFQRAQEKRSAALMPYFTLGYPDMESSVEIISAVAAESDLLELGVPFSDPLADGPTIQRSTQQSLDSGTTVAGCLRMVSQLRGRGIDTPILLMGYTNPVMAYGEEAYVRDAAAAGADGFIIPDLPLEEAGEMEQLAGRYGMALIYFLAPTSPAERIAAVARHARGFIYLVSLTGVTGARAALHADLGGFISRVRQQTNLPLAVGFGISTPEQAAQVGQLADGVIVGSALINAADAAEDKPAAARQFVKSLQAGLNHR